MYDTNRLVRDTIGTGCDRRGESDRKVTTILCMCFLFSGFVFFFIFILIISAVYKYKVIILCVCVCARFFFYVIISRNGRRYYKH